MQRSRRNQGTIAHNFLKLKKGGIYSVKRFVVLRNKDEFRVIKNATFMLELDGATTIRKVFVKTDGFIKFPFQLVDFKHLETTNNKYLIDAAGYVTNALNGQLPYAILLNLYQGPISTGYPVGIPWLVVSIKHFLNLDPR
ncbi:hypothetical protein Tco_1527949 [Tanacetum coccineum]